MIGVSLCWGGGGGGILRSELHLPSASPIFVLCLNRKGLDKGALCIEVSATCYKYNKLPNTKGIHTPET